MKEKEFIVAVVGTPNSGKTTLINSLTGSRFKVGNWPGVTVDLLRAEKQFNGHKITFLDLPGLYSLSPYSDDEKITFDCLLKSKVDLILNVIDVGKFERELSLTSELLDLEIPLVIAMNLFTQTDLVNKTINIQCIEAKLGVPSILLSAPKKSENEELLNLIVNSIHNRTISTPLKFDEKTEDLINELGKCISTTTTYSNLACSSRVIALDILTKNCLHETSDLVKSPAIRSLLWCHGCSASSSRLIKKQRLKNVRALSETDSIASNRAVRKVSNFIDQIVLDRILGPISFLFILWLMFKLTFDISIPYAGWIDFVISGPISSWISYGLIWANSPVWFHSLVIDGVVAGVGFVLVFLPVILSLTFILTFVEGSGYMARVAFLTDKLMRFLGLEGKAVIPLILGFGCNVPAIYATRTLNNKKQKIISSLLIPFMSCSARLPVYALFVSIFFVKYASLVMLSLYLIGLVLAIILGLILKKVFSSDSEELVIEMPSYHMPSISFLFSNTWLKGKMFFYKAGTFIFAISILVWLSLHLPLGVSNYENSLLGQSSKVIAPIFEPLGFNNWEATSALLTGIVAKEIIIATLGQAYSVTNNNLELALPEKHSIKSDLGDIASNFLLSTKQVVMNIFSIFQISFISNSVQSQDTLKGRVKLAFTPLSSLSYMIFVLLYMPCIVTGIAMKDELDSWKWFFLSVLLSFALAWCASLIVYQGGLIIGLE